MTEKTIALGYHGLTDCANAAERSAYNIKAEDFESQVRWVAENGRGASTLITFDDGHLSNFDPVQEILGKYGLKGIFFVTTGLIGNQRGFMGWEHVRKLSETGHSVQAHGHTHKFLNSLGDAELASELETPARLIKEHTGAAPSMMSCPGGRYDARVLAAAAKAGYSQVFTSKPGPVPGRYIVKRNWSMCRFIDVMQGDLLADLELRTIYALKSAIRKVAK